MNTQRAVTLTDALICALAVILSGSILLAVIRHDPNMGKALKSCEDFGYQLESMTTQLETHCARTLEGGGSDEVALLSELRKREHERHSQ